MNRVQILATVAVSAILLSTPAACSQSDDGTRSTRRAITQSQTIAADFLRTELALSPETASRLDLEDYLGPTAIYNLDNHSQAGFERRRLVRIEVLHRLRQRPRLPDGHALARDLAVAEMAILDLIALEQLGYGRFDYFDQRPYALDPFSGVWIEGPHLLAFQHSVNSVADASAFITRLQSLSAAIEDTKRRLIADQVAGLDLPRGLADETHRRIEALLSPDASGLDLIGSTFAALSLDLTELDPEQRRQLVRLVESEIAERLRPALQDLSTTISEMAANASDQAGIWAQPQGQALFLGVVKASTGEALSLDRTHQRHLEDVDRLVDRLKAELVLPVDAPEPLTPPKSLVELLPWYVDLVAEPVLPVAEPLEPPPPPGVILALAPATVWETIQAAPGFAAQTEAIDAFERLWTTQPYLTWRTEGEGELPAHRRLTEYPAIAEAWRQYVWHTQFEDTSGPALNNAARISIELIQAALAAADTGVHLDRWSLAQASDYIADHTGINETLAHQLALRIMARPGYHTSIVAAFHRFETLSERARAVLGERYSETDFQRTLIQPGPRPLALIETDIEAWYGARLAN